MTASLLGVRYTKKGGNEWERRGEREREREREREKRIERVSERKRKRVSNKRDGAERTWMKNALRSHIKHRKRTAC